MIAVPQDNIRSRNMQRLDEDASGEETDHLTSDEEMADPGRQPIRRRKIRKWGKHGLRKYFRKKTPREMEAMSEEEIAKFRFNILFNDSKMNLHREDRLALENERRKFFEQNWDKTLFPPSYVPPQVDFEEDEGEESEDSDDSGFVDHLVFNYPAYEDVEDVRFHIDDLPDSLPHDCHIVTKSSKNLYNFFQKSLYDTTLPIPVRVVLVQVDDVAKDLLEGYVQKLVNDMNMIHERWQANVMYWEQKNFLQESVKGRYELDELMLLQRLVKIRTFVIGNEICSPYSPEALKQLILD
ncbi:hypothetical protein L596_001719 [Steinernema carpocapsae]|uniref:Uncharacterized protein n=1 Tax=Steinernema carpocapsae TaxID=34508 RepID=A0A4U8UM23_STECR|nr:hypothetical protein L596_001719 [Steinernema carpocapsae]